jgi:hypothetical protein
MGLNDDKRHVIKHAVDLTRSEGLLGLSSGLVLSGLLLGLGLYVRGYGLGWSLFYGLWGLVVDLLCL